MGTPVFDVQAYHQAKAARHEKQLQEFHTLIHDRPLLNQVRLLKGRWPAKLPKVVEALMQAQHKKLLKAYRRALQDQLDIDVAVYDAIEMFGKSLQSVNTAKVIRLLQPEIDVLDATYRLTTFEDRLAKFIVSAPEAHQRWCNFLVKNPPEENPEGLTWSMFGCLLGPLLENHPHSSFDIEKNRRLSWRDEDYMKMRSFHFIRALLRSMRKGHTNLLCLIDVPDDQEAPIRLSYLGLSEDAMVRPWTIPAMRSLAPLGEVFERTVLKGRHFELWYPAYDLRSQGLAGPAFSAKDAYDHIYQHIRP